MFKHYIQLARDITIKNKYLCSIDGSPARDRQESLLTNTLYFEVLILWKSVLRKLIRTSGRLYMKSTFVSDTSYHDSNKDKSKFIEVII